MQTIKSRQSRSDNLGKERTWLVGVSIVNGEESNKCNLCDYLLSQVGHLRTHMKMLRGERSNECNQCIDSAVPSQLNLIQPESWADRNQVWKGLLPIQIHQAFVLQPNLNTVWRNVTYEDLLLKFYSDSSVCVEIGLKYKRLVDLNFTIMLIPARMYIVHCIGYTGYVIMWYLMSMQCQYNVSMMIWQCCLHTLLIRSFIW